MSTRTTRNSTTPTPAQQAYLRDLMCAAGHAHPRFGPILASKHYTTQRQRTSWEAFFGDMTKRQASELIDRLAK